MGEVIPIQRPEDYAWALKRIKKLWDESEVEFTPHAQQQMKKRKLLPSDVRDIIRSGTVVDHSKPGECWRYEVEGSLIDGGRASCVVETDNHLIIVTCFRINSRRIR